MREIPLTNTTQKTQKHHQDQRKGTIIVSGVHRKLEIINHVLANLITSTAGSEMQWTTSISISYSSQCLRLSMSIIQHSSRVCGTDFLPQLSSGFSYITLHLAYNFATTMAHIKDVPFCKQRKFRKQSKS